MRGVMFILVALLLTCGGAQAWEKHAMNQQIDQTNFLINDGCSGTLIDAKNGYILTAKHCIKAQIEKHEVEEVGENGTLEKKEKQGFKDATVTQYQFDHGSMVRSSQYVVKIVAADKMKDLALLQVRTHLPNTQSSPIACETPMRGDTVFVVGNPDGTLYATVGKGIVSSMDRDYKTVMPEEGERSHEPLMQISAGLIGGNSGGSVYNDAGELIGVPVIANEVHETLGWTVPLSRIKTFLADNHLEDLFARCDASQL